MAYVIRQSPSAQAFDLPFIGQDLAKVSRAIDIYAAPCQPTAEIWVYALFQAIPTLFITLTKPELIDINIHKGGHKPRRGKRFRFNASAIFRDAIVEVPVPDWKVFRIYEWGQRIGYYFMVADALEDFSINWMTTAYIYNGCQAGTPPYANLSCLDAIGSNSIIGQPVPFNVDSWHDCNPFNTHVTLTNPGPYRVTWNASWRAYNPLEPWKVPYTTVCTVDGPPGTGAQVAIGEASTNSDGVSTASGDAIFDAFDGGYTLRVSMPSAYADGIILVSGSMSVTQVDPNALGPDP